MEKKMKTKQFSMFIILVLAISLFLLACGGNNAAEETAAEPAANTANTANTVNTAEETAVEVMEDVTIRWRTRPDNQAEIELYSSISDDLDGQLDGITLIYEPGGAETSAYQDVLKTELAAGTAPDVFWIPGTDVADLPSAALF
jgi:multiple sugar transport system substrate-binding protein